MATVNVNDERLQKYESTKNSLINEAQSNYDKTSSNASQKYDELIQASKDYGKEQSELVQQQTDQAILEINQNKEKTEKDYIKEQKSAYADYAQQTNAYGVNAEKMASAGLQGSGYSESSRVSMYNTYQNRYATARESYNQAVLNYNNQITQARLQNSVKQAEIAYNSLQTQLQLALEGFQYENELLNNLINQKISISSTYDSLWQSQYSTLLGEAQFNEQMAYQRERDAVADSQWQQQFSLSKASASRTSGRSSSGGSSTKLTNGNSKSGSTKLGNSSNVETLTKYYKANEPNATDDKMGIRQHQRWRDETALAIANKKDLTEEEKAQIMVNLGLFAGNYGK